MTNAGGRPSIFSKEIVDRICKRLADGESLNSICSDEAMPSKSTVFRWLAKHETCRQRYARAREIQADTFADEILEIADDARNDWMRRNAAGNEGWQQNGEAVQRSRLRVDARKWLASKMAPKKYGDKVTQELTGADGAPLVPVLNVTISRPLTPEEWVAKHGGEVARDEAPKPIDGALARPSKG
jgi:hypothetical protein